MAEGLSPVPQAYFYCYSLPLEPGSVIRPGNWGRILRTYAPQTSPNAWLLTRELVYEMVRRRDFAHKPSRFDSVFLCLSEADLNDFRLTNNRRLDLGYEVELVNPGAPCHLADWTLPNIQNTDDVTVFEQRATLYWEGKNIVKHELITVSPIKIVRILE